MPSTLGAMGAQPEQPPTGWRSVGSWLAGRSLRQLVVGAAALALLVSAPFGGWETAAPLPVVTYPAGQSQDLGPLELRLTRVTENPNPSSAFGASEVGTYVLVRAIVRVPGDRMVDVGVLQDSVRLHGVGGLVAEPRSLVSSRVVPDEQAKPTIFHTADSTVLNGLGPGLSYEVAFVFEHVGTAFPDQVTVVSYSHIWRESFIDRQFGWRDPTKHGESTFVVQHGSGPPGATPGPTP